MHFFRFRRWRRGRLDNGGRQLLGESVGSVLQSEKAGAARFPSFAAGSSLQDEFPARDNRELIRDHRELIPPFGPKQGNGSKSIGSPR